MNGQAKLGVCILWDVAQPQQRKEILYSWIPTITQMNFEGVVLCKSKHTQKDKHKDLQHGCGKMKSTEKFIWVTKYFEIHA